MEDRRPFRTRVFLLRTLVMIFVIQLSLLVFTFGQCASLANKRMVVPGEVCPELADRTETLFGLAIATVLSLLVGHKDKPMS